MKLSEHTISVLKNYANINQNLVVKEGNELLTMSSMKNIVAKATVAESFPRELAIYDLNEFLAALVVQTPSKTITMPSEEVTFELSNSDLSKMKKASAVIGAPDMTLERLNGSSSLVAKDKKNDTANNYSLDVSTNGDGEFKFFFKVENLKLMDGSYDVAISSKNISHFKNKSSDVEYWIALEPESTYSV